MVKNFGRYPYLVTILMIEKSLFLICNLAMPDEEKKIHQNVSFCSHAKSLLK